MYTSKKKQPLPSLQKLSGLSLFILVWMDLEGFYGLSRTVSFSDGLVIVQCLLVACCSNCTRVDSALVSQSLSRTA